VERTLLLVLAMGLLCPLSGQTHDTQPVLNLTFKSTCALLLQDSPQVMTLGQHLLAQAQIHDDVNDPQGLNALISLLHDPHAGAQASLFKAAVQAIVTKESMGKDPSHLIAEADSDFRKLNQQLGIQPTSNNPSEFLSVFLQDERGIATGSFSIRLIREVPEVKLLANSLLESYISSLGRPFDLNKQSDQTEFMFELVDRPTLLVPYTRWVQQVESISSDLIREHNLAEDATRYSVAEEDAIIRKVARQQWNEFFGSRPKEFASLKNWYSVEFGNLVSYPEGSDQTKALPTLKLRAGGKMRTDGDLDFYIAANALQMVNFVKETHKSFVASVNAGGIPPQKLYETLMRFLKEYALTVESAIGLEWYKAGTDTSQIAKLQKLASRMNFVLTNAQIDQARPEEPETRKLFEEAMAKYLRAYNLARAMITFQFPKAQVGDPD
jgi:hypothetical protein